MTNGGSKKPRLSLPVTTMIHLIRQHLIVENDVSTRRRNIGKRGNIADMSRRMTVRMIHRKKKKGGVGNGAKDIKVIERAIVEMKTVVLMEMMRNVANVKAEAQRTTRKNPLGKFIAKARRAMVNIERLIVH
jgi:hypothetical protein